MMRFVKSELAGRDVHFSSPQATQHFWNHGYTASQPLSTAEVQKGLALVGFPLRAKAPRQGIRFQSPETSGPLAHLPETVIVSSSARPMMLALAGSPLGVHPSRFNVIIPSAPKIP